MAVIASVIYFAVSSFVSLVKISSYSFKMEVVTHNKFVPSKKLSQTLRQVLRGEICKQNRIFYLQRK